jgi:hypothetical protein
VHIGDFSVDRRHVDVYCPDCHQAALEDLTRHWAIQKIVTTDVGEDGIYLFITERPRAIHLND